MIAYPHTPGFKTSGPSQLAAVEETNRSAILRLKVIDAMRGQELTADECAASLGESVLSIRPRFSELLRQGKIEDAGHRRTNSSGKSATVWRLTTSEAR